VPPSGSSGWGWHRLEPAFARRLVTDAGISPGDLVLDIGAGTGAVTEQLVAAGARVIAVELHGGRAAALRERFASDRVTVVRADAADLRLPRQPFRVVANPPFAATSALLRRLLAPGTRLVRADVVLQRGAARRFASGGAPGAARWMQEFDAHVGLLLPRAAFRPRPRVDAATLVLQRR
jgi:23S rRNA (adenine-N6)-dimethyltransferase